MFGFPCVRAEAPAELLPVTLLPWDAGGPCAALLPQPLGFCLSTEQRPLRAGTMASCTARFIPNGECCIDDRELQIWSICYVLLSCSLHREENVSISCDVHMKS